MQWALYQHSGRLHLTPASHAELRVCDNLVKDLVSLPTHILKIIPPAPTWHETHNESQWILRGVFWGGGSKCPCLYHMSHDLNIVLRLTNSDNQWGNCSMDKFYLLVSAYQFSIMVPRIPSLSATRNICDNTARIVWTNCLLASHSTIAGVILHTH